MDSNQEEESKAGKDHLVEVSDEGTERDGSLMRRRTDKSTGQGSKAGYNNSLTSQPG